MRPAPTSPRLRDEPFPGAHATTVRLPVSLPALVLALAIGGCASGGGVSGADIAPGDGTPSAATLRRAGQEAMTGSGNIQVRLVDGVAFVTGNIESATDERAIERAIREVDGVEDVRIQVRREM